LGEYDQAEQILQYRASQNPSAEEDLITVMQSVFTAGWIALAQEQYELARSRFESALELAKEAEYQHGIARSHTGLAELAYAERHYQQAGDHIQATRQHFESEDARQDLSPRWQKMHMAETLEMMGAIARADGDRSSSRGYFREALTLAWAVTCFYLLLKIIVAVAELLADESQPQRAAELASLVQNDPRTLAVDKTRAGKLQTALETVISPNEHSTTVKRGKQLDLVTVVRELLAELG
jgi:tetratricopeptide (TPR) repeat protein